jgi:hypothetical protein
MTEPVQDTILVGLGDDDDAGRKDAVTSARQSVYDNGLIMSEIYGWISSKILYRQLDLKVAASLEERCSHVSQLRCPKDHNGLSICLNQAK